VARAGSVSVGRDDFVGEGWRGGEGGGGLEAFVLCFFGFLDDGVVGSVQRVGAGAGAGVLRVGS
jgi:hypothetical protein